MTLPKHHRSGVTPNRAVGAAVAEAEAGDDLVEDQQGPGRVARARAAPARNPSAGPTRFMLAATGSTSTQATDSSISGTSL